MKRFSTHTLALLVAGLSPLLAYGAGLGVGVTDRVTTVAGTATAVAVLGNDLDFVAPSTVNVITAPAHGTVTISGSPGGAGSVIANHTPSPGFNGTDSFVYSVADATSTGSATVTVTVLADTDVDGVADLQDKCTQVANPTQLDSDGDGYGNPCDADLNNSGTVTTADFGLLRSVLGQAASFSPLAAAADLNGSGTVTTADFGLLRAALGIAPGPSARRGASNSYVVTGAVSGLTGAGLVLRNNGGDNLSVTANGPFAFATGLANGAGYNVTVLTQPTNPSQTCTVSAGSGTVGIGSLPAVSLSCTTNSFAVGGVVAGRIAGSALVMQNRSEAIAMLGNGYFSFPTKLKSGAKYSLSVNTQPANPDQTCGVQNGAGTGIVGASDISTLNVACAINGKWYYSANTVLNTLSIYSVNPTTGALTPVGSPVAAQEPGPTAVVTDPTGRFAYVTTKGATPSTTAGKVWVYTINSSTGALTLVTSIATGKSPRSITLDGTATYAWVANTVANTVSSYRINGDGTLAAVGSPVATGPGPEDVIVFTEQNSSGTLANRWAYVAVSGGGIWTYAVNSSSGALSPVSNGVLNPTDATAPVLRISIKPTPPDPWAHVIDRTANAIKLYRISPATGALTLLNTYPTGPSPRALVYNRQEAVAYVVNSGDNTVSAYGLNPSNGTLSPFGSPAATGPAPVSLTLDPRGTLAYVVNSGDGTVSSYSVNPDTGALTPTGATVAADTTTVVTTPAAGLATPFTGNPLALALNTPPSGGSNNNLQAFTIDTSTGELALVGAPFQGLGSSGGSVYLYFAVGTTASGTFVYVSNLTENTVSAVRIDPLTGALTVVSGNPFPTGYSPKGVAVDPRGAFAYVASGSGPSGAIRGISAFSIDPVTGALSTLPGSPFVIDFQPSSVVVDPSGSFVYVLGVDDSINEETGDFNQQFPFVGYVWAFSINRSTGALTPAGPPVVSGGQFPQLLTVDPSGRFLYTANPIGLPPAHLPFNTPSRIGAFRIDSVAGTLAPISGAPFTAGTNCTSIAINPSGTFAYATDAVQGQVYAYRIDAETGVLTPVAGGPYPTGGGARSVVVDASGKFVYTANAFGAQGQPTVSAFSIDQFSGALTPIAGNPFPGGSGPVGISVTP